MARRSERAAIAQQTLLILSERQYRSPSGSVVSIADAMASAIERSELYTPNRLRKLVKTLRPREDLPCRIEVVNETTLAAARRLLDSGRDRVMALNFASARNPGGGFLNGSQAQEESLARASGIYLTLTRHPEMYETNRRFDSCVYTDHMIYSPAVPVFRDDDDVLLERPYLVSFLTAPAVNAGVVRRREPDHDRIAIAMRSRIEMVLAVAAEKGYESLVLGAWGCGVFGNDPTEVAGWFACHLTEGGYKGAFRDVVFAVWDRTRDQSAFLSFARQFAAGSNG